MNYCIKMGGHLVKDDHMLPRVFNSWTEAEIYCMEKNLPAYAEVAPYDDRADLPQGEVTHGGTVSTKV